MKSLLLLALIFLVGCARQSDIGRVIYTDIDDFQKGGMHYIIYNNEIKGGMFIINVTKDSLETEYLKQQLNKKP